MAKFIFFDAAETLVTKPDLLPTLSSTLRVINPSLTTIEIRKAHYRTREEYPAPDRTDENFYLRFNQALLTELDMMPDPNVAQRIFKSCRGLYWNAFDDVGSLKELTCPLGIISNWSEKLRPLLKTLVPVEFSQIIISEEAGAKKPSPSIFEAAISAVGEDPKDVIYVGDSLKLDILPAKRLGLRAILLDRHNIHKHYPNEKISSLKELHGLA